MPYVKPGRRELLNPLIQELSSSISSVGDLNYVITMLCLSEAPDSYDDYNALVGVLESAKLEFYRRAVSAYEDTKVGENGDCYPDGSSAIYVYEPEE